MPTKVGIHDFAARTEGKVMDADLRRHDGDGGWKVTHCGVWYESRPNGTACGCKR
jgi:hypothetical protein